MLEDFAQLAASHSRESFVAFFSHPFLVGEAVLRQPQPGRRTLGFESGRTFSAEEQALAKREAARLVLAVKKSQTTFPSMITVGRTKNNDIVVPDLMISKFHAFFRHVATEYDLADAGSQNGTRVGDQVVVPKGPPVRVRLGDVIHFAALRFKFVDAGACWDELHSH
jgi:hypothetical protein